MSRLFSRSIGHRGQSPAAANRQRSVHSGCAPVSTDVSESASSSGRRSSAARKATLPTINPRAMSNWIGAGSSPIVTATVRLHAEHPLIGDYSVSVSLLPAGVIVGDAMTAGVTGAPGTIPPLSQ